VINHVYSTDVHYTLKHIEQLNTNIEYKSANQWEKHCERDTIKNDSEIKNVGRITKEERKEYRPLHWLL